VAGALIVGAISFNAVLCFLNTRGIAIGKAHVMMSEMLLISAALLATRNYLSFAHISVLTLVVAYALALSFLRYANVPATGFDFKISRDFVIPIAFFLLGKAVSDVKMADKVVFICTAILLSFAVFEFFFLDAFLEVFSVARYYIARGTLENSGSALNISQGLMASGVRPPDQGRTLLSFLGDHRVSSLFLEPISLGNFGTLVALWAVVRSRMEGKLYFWLGLSGVALVILSDGRFNACAVVLGVAILMIPPRITTLVVLPLPLIVTLALYLFGASVEQYYNAPPRVVEGLGVYDRVLYCARVLYYFDIYNWFGLEASPAQTFDAGYAYVISNIGILGLAMLWLLFMLIPGWNPYYFSFRNAVAVYLAALLCISNSPFTIKTSAPLWFLLGVLSAFQTRPSSPKSRVLPTRSDRAPVGVGLVVTT
jgi:putative polymerase